MPRPTVARKPERQYSQICPACSRAASRQSSGSGPSRARPRRGPRGGRRPASQAGEQRVDQVGAADGALQEAAAAEERRPFEVAVPDDVRLVVQRVARGVEDLDLEGADRDDVSALDRQPVELDPLLG